MIAIQWIRPLLDREPFLQTTRLSNAPAQKCNFSAMQECANMQLCAFTRLGSAVVGAFAPLTNQNFHFCRTIPSHWLLFAKTTLPMIQSCVPHCPERYFIATTGIFPHRPSRSRIIYCRVFFTFHTFSHISANSHQFTWQRAFSPELSFSLR
jgi:hypothetical protein